MRIALPASLSGVFTAVHPWEFPKAKQQQQQQQNPDKQTNSNNKNKQTKQKTKKDGSKNGSKNNNNLVSVCSEPSQAQRLIAIINNPEAEQTD